MYDFNTRVYVKSVERCGFITERNYIGKPRRASYLVSFDDGGGKGDYLTGSSDLRRADRCCDGCSRWLPDGSFIGGATARDGEYPHGLTFCFLCTREGWRNPYPNEER